MSSFEKYIRRPYDDYHRQGRKYEEEYPYPYDTRGYSEDYSYSNIHESLSRLLNRIKYNKRLQVLIFAGILVLLIAAAAALILLLPFLIKLLSSMDKNGIKGLIDTIAPFLNLLLKFGGD